MPQLSGLQLWVHDQEAALAFYTEKLGWEVRTDVTMKEMGNFRWLTVGPPEQPDTMIVLMLVPGPPMMDPDSTTQLRNLMSKGFAGTLFLTTENCQADYENLQSRGVEFSEKPEQHPYGIDAAFRDPSGNHIRLTQVTPM
jgi:predicted enzyme related to lactoylglutathione lyase